MTELVRKGRRTLPGDALQLLAGLADELNLDLSERNESEDVSRIADIVQQARNPIMLHGRRVEEMFEYVVRELGVVKALKREEVSTLLVQVDQDVSIPDYRLLLNDGSEIFVEVKNCHNRSPHKAARITQSYLKRLANYGRLFQHPVYVAIYWSRWRLWSLLSADQLLSDDRLRGASLLKASEFNQMSVLGDFAFATKFPLTLILEVEAQPIADEPKVQQIVATITDVRMFSSSTEIISAREKSIAFAFMIYGSWRETGPEPTLNGAALRSIKFTFEPEQTPTDDFAIVAFLSTLASAAFNAATADARGIRRLRLKTDTISPYPRLGDSFQGETLPLWRFVAKGAGPAPQ
jgi:hypothetical protein